MDDLIRLSRKAANEWRNNDAYYQASVLIDSLCDRLEDSVPVVRCSECVLSGSCTQEDIFRLVAGIERPFCCAGKRKDGEG